MTAVRYKTESPFVIFVSPLVSGALRGRLAFDRPTAELVGAWLKDL